MSNTFDLYKRADELHRELGYAPSVALQLASELAEAIAGTCRESADISDRSGSTAYGSGLMAASSIALSFIKPKQPPSKTERMLREIEDYYRCRAIAQEEEKP